MSPRLLLYSTVPYVLEGGQCARICEAGKDSTLIGRYCRTTCINTLYSKVKMLAFVGFILCFVLRTAVYDEVQEKILVAGLIELV